VRFPAVFIAHGSPMLALEREGAYARALRRFAGALPRPRAIVVVSAHWEAPRPVRATAAGRPPLIYDFRGFPRELYEVRYPAPGDPALAAEVVSLLGAAAIEARPEPRRGWDHGVWSPLSLAFPEADVPVVEVSLPEPRTEADVLALGRALAPLREREVLLVGSGVIVHNLGLARLDDRDAPVDAWARDFDAWVAARVEALDVAALAAYRERAPHADLAVPTPEHFDPLLFVVGAARAGERVETIADGFEHANLSMRSFALRA
jgi:4,5-DOPA dioxygenase extradiol